MKPAKIMAVTSVLVLTLSSCATRNASQLQSIPVYYADPDAPYRGSSFDYSHQQTYSGLDPADAAPANIWPRMLSSDAMTALVYQPQIDLWDGHQLTARSAVAVQSAGAPQPIYGIVTFTADTLVDKTKRLVTLEGVQVASTDFPSLQAKTTTYVNFLNDALPQQLKMLSLDFLQGGYAAATSQLKTPSQPLNNTPPKIIISQRPAILVSIDGPPAYRPVFGTTLQRVINTRILLLKDTVGLYYLHVLNGYMKAPGLNGPWTVAEKAPLGATEAEKQAQDSSQVDLLEQTDSDIKPQPLLNNYSDLAIFVVTTPSELITFNGDPDFIPIPGTQLLYAANTTGNVFKWLSDQQIYVLLAGRWFRAPSLEGPWQFEPAAQLPRDFANIPDSSPKENVKASVPGTMQANEALIANSIPQSTRVHRTARMENPQLDGPPQLKPIEGTPLSYVVNSATPIIKVDDHSWYACQNGIWYVSSSDNGPWSVADSVPPVIYSIPTTSPLHYLTYLQVYDATPDYVYEGYTPGYLGTEVSPDGTVVYGTGYNYSPWIGSDWYGPPETWGLGWDDCWTPWWGWGFGCGFGCDFFPVTPCWGAFRHRGDFDRGRFGSRRRGDWTCTARNIYRRDGRLGADHFDAFASGERAGVFGHAYNSRTGMIAAGQRAHVQNAFSAMPISRGGAGLPPNAGFAGRGSGSGVWGTGNHLATSFHPMPFASPRFQSWTTQSSQKPENWMHGRGDPRFDDYRSPSPVAGFHGWNGFQSGARGFMGGGSGGSFHGGGGGGFHGGGGGGGGGGHR